MATRRPRPPPHCPRPARPTPTRARPRLARHRHPRRARAQPPEPHAAAAAPEPDRDHRRLGLGQVVARVRHALRRGPAPLRRVAVGLRAPVPRPDGEARRRRDRGAVAGDRDRAARRGSQPALDGRHHHRDLRLPAAAVRAARHAALSRTAARCMARQSVQEMVDHAARALHAAQRIALLAPLVRGRKGEYRKELERVRRQGYLRARIDGEWVELDEPPKLGAPQAPRHRRSWSTGSRSEPDARARLADSLEAALKLGSGHGRGARARAPRRTCCSARARRAPSAAPASMRSSRAASRSTRRTAPARAATDSARCSRWIRERVVPDPRRVDRRGRGRGVGRRRRHLDRRHAQGARQALRLLAHDAVEEAARARPASCCSTAPGDEEVRFEFRTQEGLGVHPHEHLRGRDPEPRAALSRDLERSRCGAGSASLMNPTPCPECQRRAAASPRASRCRIDGRNIGEWIGAARCAGARAGWPSLRFEGAQAHDRAADPEGARRPARVPRRRGARLPDARPRRGERWRAARRSASGSPPRSARS